MFPARLRGLWSRVTIPGRLVAVSGALLALWAAMFQYSVLQGEFATARQKIVQDLSHEIDLLLPPLAEQAVIGDYELIGQMIRARAQREAVVTVTWVDARGTRLVATSAEPERHVPAWFEDWANMPRLEVARDVVIGGEKYGAVTVHMTPVPSLNVIWNGLLDQLEVLLLGVGVLLAGILAVVNSSLRPLYALAAGARKFGSGDYSLRLEREGPPEMADTAAAFNHMAGSLERSLRSLRESNASNQLLAAIVEQSRDAIVTKDLAGRITSWNAAAEGIFKYRAEEVIGKPISILHPGQSGEEFDRVLSRIAAGHSAAFEAQHRTRDGMLVTIAASVSPQYDESGRHVGEISVIRDITDEKRAEEALFAEQERARVTLDSIGDGVITTDTAGTVEYLNPVAEKLTGWKSGEARGCRLDEVFRILRGACPGAESDEGRPASRWKLRESGAGEWTLLSLNGGMVPIEDKLAPIRDRTGEIVGTVLAFRDVSESRKLREQLSWQASHDALTGLVNRRDFERQLEALVEDAQRAGRHHALLCLDLDQFKVVNDTCGHVAGDEMLRQLAQRLIGGLRESDVLARLGGDEFGVLLQRCSLDRAAAVAEKLRASLADYRFAWQTNTFSVSVSIGIAEIASNGENAASILGSADAACFSAKDQGRNRIQVYRPDDAEMAVRRVEMQWVSRINQAFEKDRLRLYCQAIVPVKERAGAAHYEVLLRMVDEDGRDVPPLAFIPAAERYNLMPAIDRWVVSHVFAFLAEHFPEREGGALPLISINLSGSTLSDDSFPVFLRAQFDRYSVPAAGICFEITETAAIANLSRAVRFMSELKRIGCRFSLDDFGSGLSSFAYLKNLPVDFLKIDGSFVKDMAKDPIDCAMVEAINKVGHVMGIETIAEFVENDLTLGMLKTIGVDYAQGYGIGRPMPIESVLLLQEEPALAAVPLHLVGVASMVR